MKAFKNYIRICQTQKAKKPIVVSHSAIWPRQVIEITESQPPLREQLTPSPHPTHHSALRHRNQTQPQKLRQSCIDSLVSVYTNAGTSAKTSKGMGGNS
jgi:hypothetical protein